MLEPNEGSSTTCPSAVSNAEADGYREGDGDRDLSDILSDLERQLESDKKFKQIKGKIDSCVKHPQTANVRRLLSQTKEYQDLSKQFSSMMYSAQGSHEEKNFRAAYRQSALALYIALRIFDDKLEILRALNNAAIALKNQYCLSEALAYFRRAEALGRELKLPDENPEMLILLQNVSNVLSKLGHFDEELQYCNRLLSVNAQAFAIRHNRGLIFCNQGKYDEALVEENLALQLCRDRQAELTEKADVKAKSDKARLAKIETVKEKEKSKKEEADILHDIGVVYHYKGLLDLARKYYEVSEKLAQRLYGADSIQIVGTLQNKAVILATESKKQRDYLEEDHQKSEEARLLWKRAREILQKTVQDSGVEIADILDSRGTHAQGLNRLDEALELHRGALTIYKDIYREPISQYKLADTLYNIGLVLFKQQNFDEAITEQRRALSIYGMVYKLEHPRCFVGRSALAKSYTLRAAHTTVDEKRACDLKEAVKLYKDNLTINRQLLGKSSNLYDFVGHDRLLKELAMTYCLKHQPREAAELFYEEAIAYQCPAIRLRHATEALWYYKRIPDIFRRQAELYYLVATIYGERSQWRKAYLNISKAIQIDKTRTDWPQQAGQWERDWMQEKKELDPDIYAELESCTDKVYELEQLYLDDLDKGDSLSDRTKNETTELMIRFDSLLDQGYGHLVRKRMPNLSSNIDLYFPCAESQQSFEEELSKSGILESLRSLDSFQAILEMQPFSVTQGHSILKQIRAISDDSKHVQLSAQGVRRELSESIGTVRRGAVRIQIQYFDRKQFYEDIGNILRQKVANLGDKDLRNLIFRIFRILRDHEYVNYQTVSHEKLKNVLDAQKAGLPLEYQGRFKREFFQQLQKDLEPLQKGVLHQIGIVHDIGELLIRQFSIPPIEAPTFIQAAHEQVCYVIRRLAQDTHAQPVSLNLPSKSASVSGLVQELEEQLIQYSRSLKAFDHLKRYHQTLKELAKIYYTQGQSDKVGDLYRSGALCMKQEKYDWLAWKYYEKAKQSYQKSPNRYAELVQVYQEKRELSHQLGLFKKAIMESTFGAEHHPSLVGQTEQLRRVTPAEMSTWDEDLYSQWEHAQEQYYHLLYLCLKLSVHLQEKPFLVERIQVAAITIIVKIRHLLDQGFDRWVDCYIDQPREYIRPRTDAKTTLHFPCVGSELRLMNNQWSKIDRIRELGPGNPSIDKYPEIVKVIQHAQPYYFYELEQNRNEPDFCRKSWLNQIMSISNQTKHEGFVLPSVQEIERRATRATSVDQVFSMRCIGSGKRIYPWSFIDLFQCDSFEDKIGCSTTLVEELKGKQYVKQDGTIQSSHVKKLVNNIRMRAGQDVIHPQRQQILQDLKRIPLLSSTDDESVSQVLNTLLLHVDPTLEITDPITCNTSIIPVLNHALKDTKHLLTLFFKKPKPAVRQSISGHSIISSSKKSRSKRKHIHR